MDILQAHLAPHKNLVLALSTALVISTSAFLIVLFRIAQILPTPRTPADETKLADTTRRPSPSSPNPTHLLVVLGSGGHTAEILNILSSSQPALLTFFTHRTYLVSSGDSFSAIKAAEFEKAYQQTISRSNPDKNGVTSVSSTDESYGNGTYSVVTVRRARRVHQSFLSSPLTALACLQDCVAVLRGTHADLQTGHNKSQNHKNEHISYPDLIITNGPGTGVIVVLAALILKFCGYGGAVPSWWSLLPSPANGPHSRGQMKTIFIESWARVKTLSLSGKILRPLVNRFIVQWPQLADTLGEGAEYIGPLVT